MEPTMSRTFSLTPIPEVPLASPPLAKVIMQVRYSLTAGLISDAAELALAEALGRYPVRHRLQAPVLAGLVINGQPMPVSPRQETVLQFANTTGDWRVAMSESSVSLETESYESRDDFISRALELFKAIASIQLPPVVDRVGLRYIDRLTGDDLSRIPEYVVPQLRAMAGSVDPNLRIEHSVTDSLIHIGQDAQLQARTGLLPAGGTFDPTLRPLAEPSWVLDIDVATNKAGFAFESAELSSRLSSYADAAYAFFRYTMTDAFQNHYRAERATPAEDVR
jgi:uncharacterized protein (TIGR04255 family)